MLAASSATDCGCHTVQRMLAVKTRNPKYDALVVLPCLIFFDASDFLVLVLAIFINLVDKQQWQIQRAGAAPSPALGA